MVVCSNDGVGVGKVGVWGLVVRLVGGYAALDVFETL